MSTLTARRRPGKHTHLSWGILLGILVVAGVVLTAYQLEFGLSKPSSSSQRMIDRARVVTAVASETDDYWEYAAVLQEARADLNDYHTVADADVRQLVGESLGYCEAAREAWYLEHEGDWDPVVHGTVGFWAAHHPELEWTLPAEKTLTVADVKRYCWERAPEGLEEAQRIVER